MSYISNHKHQFDDLKFQIANQDQLRRQANGGNILRAVTPAEFQIIEILGSKVTLLDH